MPACELRKLGKIGRAPAIERIGHGGERGGRGPGCVLPRGTASRCTAQHAFEHGGVLEDARREPRLAAAGLRRRHGSAAAPPAGFQVGTAREQRQPGERRARGGIGAFGLGLGRQPGSAAGPSAASVARRFAMPRSNAAQPASKRGPARYSDATSATASATPTPMPICSMRSSATSSAEWPGMAPAERMSSAATGALRKPGSAAPAKASSITVASVVASIGAPRCCR